MEESSYVVNHQEAKQKSGIPMKTFLGFLLGLILLLGVGYAATKMISSEEAAETGSETVIIWLKSSIDGDVLTDDELDEVSWQLRSNLERNPLIRDFSYIDKDETVIEILQYSKGSPLIRENMSTDVVPTSFIVIPDEEGVSYAEAIADSVERPGVDSVQIAKNRDDLERIRQIWLERAILFGSDYQPQLVDEYKVENKEDTDNSSAVYIAIISALVGSIVSATATYFVLKKKVQRNQNELLYTQ